MENEKMGKDTMEKGNKGKMIVNLNSLDIERIKKNISADLPFSEVEIEKHRQETKRLSKLFRSKFEPNKLENLDLKQIFSYSEADADANKDQQESDTKNKNENDALPKSLHYYLTREAADSKNKFNTYFGDAGNQAAALYVYYSQGIWKKGAGSKPEIIDESTAKQVKEDLIECLTAGVQLIEVFQQKLNNNEINICNVVKEYSELISGLSEKFSKKGLRLGQSIVKYYTILFPDIFSGFYIQKFINPMLDYLGIYYENTENSDELMVKSGVIAYVNSRLLSLPYVCAIKLLDESELSKIANYKQIVFTGAPGTGKTYGILQYLEKVCNKSVEYTYQLDKKRTIKQYEFIQFHSSYDYTDFVEGLRPVEENGSSRFKKMDGVFKSFCRDVAEYNASPEGKEKPLRFYFFIDEINRADIGKVFGELMFSLEEDYRMKPIPTQYSSLKSTYYIDENRELRRFDDEGARKDIFEGRFFIPENVHIIGSMNDIDRSVDTFDFALRRRFQWVNIEANKVMQPTLGKILKNRNVPNEKVEKLATNVINMNNVMEQEEYRQFLLNKAYHIGPAYFKNFDGSKESLKTIWEEKVQSILTEYVRGRDADTVKSFLNDCHEKLMEGIE